MLPDLIRSGRTRKKTRDFLNSAGFVLPVSPPLPVSFSNLTNWFQASGISVLPIAPFTATLVDDIQPITLLGTIVPTPPNQETTLNGNTAMIMPTHELAQIAPAADTICLPTFTMFCVIKLNNPVPTGRYCHIMVSDATARTFLFQNGNLLQWNARTANGSTISLVSLTDFAAAGWQVVCVQWDIVTKSATMFEGGNILTGTDLTMNTFPCTGGPYRLTNLVTLNAGWNGGLGEFFYYSDLKNVPTINTLGNYLANKHGISWTDVPVLDPDFDGNALAWYDGNVGLSDAQWNDQSAGGHDIVFANSPTIVSNATPLRDAVRFDGINQNGLVTTPVTIQPFTIYVVLNTLVWTIAKRVWDDGVVAVSKILSLQGSTPNLAFEAGFTNLSTDPDLAVGTWGVYTCVANGVSSEIRTNLNVPIVGNAGALNSSGIKLASSLLNVQYWNGELGYLIIRTGADSTAVQNYIINGLKEACGLTF